MKQPMTIQVRGREHVWSFTTKADPKFLQEWQADGVEIFLLSNTIPEWAVDLGLTWIWCRVQDVWNKGMRLW